MKKFLAKKSREDGFTLIELLVVVIIIAILAAVAVPVYIGIQNNAKKSGLQSDVATTKLNLAAALTEDGTIASGTYTASGKSGDATVQNSGIGGDEVVTVVYNTDGSFTVSAKSAKLNYTAAADSTTGQQSGQTGPTPADQVTIGTKIFGAISGANGNSNYIMITGPVTDGNPISWTAWGQKVDASNNLPTVSSTLPEFNNLAKYTNNNFNANYHVAGMYDASGVRLDSQPGYANCYNVQPRVSYHWYSDDLVAGFNLSCTGNDLSQVQMDKIAKFVITNGGPNYTYTK